MRKCNENIHSKVNIFLIRQQVCTVSHKRRNIFQEVIHICPCFIVINSGRGMMWLSLPRAKKKVLFINNTFHDHI